MSDRKKPPSNVTELAKRRKPGRTRLPSIATLDKERRALEMRRAKASYTDIARAVGYSSASGAYEAVQRAIKRHTQGNVEELRREELDMLDRLHLAHWPAAVGTQNNPADVSAGYFVLKVSERRARLLGLDAAVAIKATVTDAVDAEIEELIRQLAELDAQQPNGG